MDHSLDRLKLLNAKDRSAQHPLIHPRDAASLIVIDRRHFPVKILMGLRHQEIEFMPDVYVFPGGALDLADLSLAKSYLSEFQSEALKISILSGRDSQLLETYKENELFTPSSRPGISRLAGIPVNFAATSNQTMSNTGILSTQRELGAGLVLCALRELYEETGLHLDEGTMKSSTDNIKQDHPFSPQCLPPERFFPVFENIYFLSRAITPPGNKQRFDTRFFLHDYDGPVSWAGNGDNELVKTVWVNINEALTLKLHPMTRVILQDVIDHMTPPLPFKQPSKVSFYQYSDKRFEIDSIEMETPS